MGKTRRSERAETPDVAGESGLPSLSGSAVSRTVGKARPNMKCRLNDCPGHESLRHCRRPADGIHSSTNSLKWTDVMAKRAALSVDAVTPAVRGTHLFAEDSAVRPPRLC